LGNKQKARQLRKGSEQWPKGLGQPRKTIKKTVGGSGIPYRPRYIAEGLGSSSGNGKKIGVAAEIREAVQDGCNRYNV